MKTFTLSRAIDNIKECNKSTQKRPLSFHQISSTHFVVVFQEKRETSWSLLISLRNIHIPSQWKRCRRMWMKQASNNLRSTFFPRSNVKIDVSHVQALSGNKFPSFLGPGTRRRNWIKLIVLGKLTFSYAPQRRFNKSLENPSELNCQLWRR